MHCLCCILNGWVSPEMGGLLVVHLLQYHPLPLEPLRIPLLQTILSRNQHSWHTHPQSCRISKSQSGNYLQTLSALKQEKIQLKEQSPLFSYDFKYKTMYKNLFFISGLFLCPFRTTLLPAMPVLSGSL